MRTVIFFIAAMLLCFTFADVKADTVVYYTYDNAGNRTGRIIVYSPNHSSKAAQKDDNDFDTTDIEEEETFNDIAEQSQNVDIKVYPNPTADFLHIKTNSGAESTERLRYILHGSVGETLLNGQFDNHTEISLDISRYSGGTYFLTLYNSTEKRVWKIIKQ